jgi:hypothetical protein
MPGALKAAHERNSSRSAPSARCSVREVFGIDSDLMVPAFAERDDHVPEIDAPTASTPT